MPVSWGYMRAQYSLLMAWVLQQWPGTKVPQVLHVECDQFIVALWQWQPPPPPAPQLVADLADLFCQLPNSWNTYCRLTKHLWLVVCLEGHYIHTGVQPQWCANWYSVFELSAVPILACSGVGCLDFCMCRVLSQFIVQPRGGGKTMTGLPPTPPVHSIAVLHS